MQDEDIRLFAHLMRRAGFGATRDEIEELAEKGYEAAVEDLLHPERFPEHDDHDLLRRYGGALGNGHYGGEWEHRMINSQRPLAEKMALFCHHVFATATEKSQIHVYDQIDMLRRVGLSDLRTILTRLSADPAMLMWLDNQENFKDEPNENYGRELLELFSMGVGNYTEQDVKASTMAFTGWTFETPIPGGSTRRGSFPTRFIYQESEHDDSVKSFLGETGRLNGEDIVDIIVKQPATARFISRHLYTFFVADEPQVAAWNEVPPQDPGAIDTLVKAYFDSGANMREILRVLLNSDFFKDAQFKRVKSPVELVIGLTRLLGTHRVPEPGPKSIGPMGAMGQSLMNPLTVEGWHTGPEWIDGGTLNSRVNFAVDAIGDGAKPGVRSIIDRIGAERRSVSPDEFVDTCLDLAGPVVVEEDTRRDLTRQAESEGELHFGSDAEREESEARILRMLQLVVSTREFQFG